MDKEQIKKIIEDSDRYDETKEDGYRAMLREFYSRKMLSTALFVWAHFLIFLALAILSGVLFFRTDRADEQIMYASFFVCCIIISFLIKVFAWLRLHENSIKRELKRLELRIAELAESLAAK
jgi:ABC-type spermidine/putrescine transport system permease subunit I